MLNTPFSAEAARYARVLAAQADRFTDPNTALAQLLDRWSTGAVTDRRERRIAARLSAERAAVPGLTNAEFTTVPDQEMPTLSGAHLTVVSGDDDEEAELRDDLDGFYDDALEVLP
jgi:hypothetical protein